MKRGFIWAFVGPALLIIAVSYSFLYQCTRKGARHCPLFSAPLFLIG